MFLQQEDLHWPNYSPLVWQQKWLRIWWQKKLEHWKLWNKFSFKNTPCSSLAHALHSDDYINDKVHQMILVPSTFSITLNESQDEKDERFLRLPLKTTQQTTAKLCLRRRSVMPWLSNTSTLFGVSCFLRNKPISAAMCVKQEAQI